MNPLLATHGSPTARCGRFRSPRRHRGIAEGLSVGDRVALRDPEGVVLAVLQVEEVWQSDLEREAFEIH